MRDTVTGQFLTGEYHPYWKGDEATYSSVHKWLVGNYGKADHCEVCGTKRDDISYEWAHIFNGIYRHSRSDFKMMCRPCHTKLDMTPEWKAKVAEGMRAIRRVKKWTTPSTLESRAKISAGLKKAYAEGRR